MVHQHALALPHGGGLALGAGAALRGEALRDAEAEEAAPPPFELVVGEMVECEWHVEEREERIVVIHPSIHREWRTEEERENYKSVRVRLHVLIYLRLICAATLRGGMWSPMKSPTYMSRGSEGRARQG